MPLRSIVPFGMALALLAWVGVGCRPSSEKSPEQAGPSADAKPSAARRPAGSALQGALDQLATLPIEMAPEKRPRVVSERAPDSATWARQVLIRGYRESGFADGPGSAEALVAFERYSRQFSTGLIGTAGTIAEAARAAQDAGSKDPFIRYLQLRYEDSDDARGDQVARAQAFVEVAAAVHGTRHHPLFKFMAAYRASSNVRAADRRAIRRHIDTLANVHMEDVVRDTNAAPNMVAEYLMNWTRFASSAAWTDWVMGDTGRLLSENWRGTALYEGVMADLEVKRAWDARGGGYANTVSDDGWRKMEAHLASAEEHLAKAWEMDPRNPELAVVGLRIELGQGKGRAVADRWFQRAMAIDPNHYDACLSMAYYLEPKWHGSEAECLSFARKCVRTEGWGGRVPMVLVSVHHNLAAWKGENDSPAYWRRPQVWTDIREAYEKFFKVNTGPDVEGWRHNYARDAFLCGKYEEFLTQVGHFGSRTNHAFFGGQAAFDGMLARARAASGRNE